MRTTVLLAHIQQNLNLLNNKLHSVQTITEYVHTTYYMTDKESNK